MNGTTKTCEMRTWALLLVSLLWVLVGVLCQVALAAEGGTSTEVRIAGSDTEWRAYRLVAGTVSAGKISNCSTEGLMNPAFWRRAGITGGGQDAAEELSGRVADDAHGRQTARLGRIAVVSGAPFVGVSKTSARAGFRLSSGYWLLTSEGFQPMLVLVGDRPLALSPKSTPPSVRKQVKGARTGWRQAVEAGCGGMVSYRIVATLPSNAAAYDELPYVIVDGLPSGLDVEMSSLRVEARGHDLAGEDITDRCAAMLSKGELRVDIGKGNALEAIPGDPDGARVVVTYRARMTSAASSGARRGNPNTAHVEYRGSPTSEKTRRTERVRAQLFTWILRVDKLGRDGALGDAVFELRDSSGSAFGRVVTAENGRAEFPSVPSGDYELVETDSPAGYLRASDTRIALRAELGEAGDAPSLSASARGAGKVSSCDAKTGVVTVEVRDDPAPALGSGARGQPPDTGDVAPALLALGAAACACGVALLARRTRSRGAARREIGTSSAVRSGAAQRWRDTGQ